MVVGLLAKALPSIIRAAPKAYSIGKSVLGVGVKQIPKATAATKIIAQRFAQAPIVSSIRYGLGALTAKQIFSSIIPSSKKETPKPVEPPRVIQQPYVHPVASRQTEIPGYAQMVRENYTGSVISTAPAVVQTGSTSTDTGGYIQDIKEEGFIAATIDLIKENPVAATAIAAGSGAIIGGAVGYAVGKKGKKKTTTKSKSYKPKPKRRKKPRPRGSSKRLRFGTKAWMSYIRGMRGKKRHRKGRIKRGRGLGWGEINHSRKGTRMVSFRSHGKLVRFKARR